VLSALAARATPSPFGQRRRAGRSFGAKLRPRGDAACKKLRNRKAGTPDRGIPPLSARRRRGFCRDNGIGRQAFCRIGRMMSNAVPLRPQFEQAHPQSASAATRFGSLLSRAPAIQRVRLSGSAGRDPRTPQLGDSICSETTTLTGRRAFLFCWGPPGGGRPLYIWQGRFRHGHAPGKRLPGPGSPGWSTPRAKTAEQSAESVFGWEGQLKPDGPAAEPRLGCQAPGDRRGGLPLLYRILYRVVRGKHRACSSGETYAGGIGGDPRRSAGAGAASPRQRKPPALARHGETQFGDVASSGGTGPVADSSRSVTGSAAERGPFGLGASLPAVRFRSRFRHPEASYHEDVIRN